MNRKGKPKEQDVVCRRELTWLAVGVKRPVSITVFAPRPFRSRHKSPYECVYRIDGLGSQLDLADEDAHTENVLGVDSVQALMLAFTLIYMQLQPHEASLAFLDQPGDHGFPLILEYSNDYGAEFRGHIRTLVERETEDFLIRKYGADLIRPTSRRAPPS